MLFNRKKDNQRKQKQDSFKTFTDFVESVNKNNPDHLKLIVKMLAQHYYTDRQISVMKGNQRENLPFNQWKLYSIDSWIEKNPEMKLYKRAYELSDVPTITNIWNRERFLGCLKGIGSDNNNPFDQNSNHLSVLIFPVELIAVYNGNHSINAALMKGEGCVVPTDVLDWTEYYDEDDIYFDGFSFISKSGKDMKYFEHLPEEFGLIFEIGRLIYSNEK